MNLIDLCLLLALLSYALSGYRLGFLVGAASTVSLLTGGLVGVLVAPALLDGFDASVALSVAALVVVVVCATAGQALGAILGAAVRAAVTWRPARTVDAVGGAALSTAAVLVIAWGLGYAVSGARIPWLGSQVRGSYVLSVVDVAMPDGAEQVLGAFDDVVGSELFPRYLQPFVPEQIIPVAPPDDSLLADGDVRRAAASVVKVLGEAEQCNRLLEGSGFVYAPDRVMTNAHVVAGVSDVVVEVAGEELDAEVVLFDTELDVAVLSVEDIDARPLDFGPTGREGGGAVVMGFPENGPFDARPARIRAEQRLRSPDIYGDGSHEREVLSVRSRVRSGNSGGPLVSPQGEVLGVIFAASVSDTGTGYALTADQVAGSAGLGRGADEAVSAGDCS